MSFWDINEIEDDETSIMNILNSAKESLEHVDDEHLRKRSLSYIKECDSKFRDLQSNAFKNKDTLQYVYATGILFLIMNCDSLEHDNDLSEIVKLMKIVTKDAIDKELLLRIRNECYKLGHNTFDIDAAPELRARHFSIGDLLGYGASLLNEGMNKPDDFLNQL